MTYFFPAGGGGIVIPGLAANSSKLAGTRWFCSLQSRSAWFNGTKSGPALLVIAAGAGLGAGLESTGVGWADGDSAAGCAALFSGVGAEV